jgi:hypothetical protein
LDELTSENSIIEKMKIMSAHAQFGVLLHRKQLARAFAIGGPACRDCHAQYGRSIQLKGRNFRCGGKWVSVSGGRTPCSTCAPG